MEPSLLSSMRSFALSLSLSLSLPGLFFELIVEYLSRSSSTKNERE